MYIKYVSRKNQLLIVYCNINELYECVFRYLNVKMINAIKNDESYFVSDLFSKINPSLLEPSLYTVVISGEGNISVQQPAFPFSGMWNDQDDFEIINVINTSLDEILTGVKNGNAFAVDGKKLH